jgi:hypothetical protein
MIRSAHCPKRDHGVGSRTALRTVKTDRYQSWLCIARAGTPGRGITTGKR